MIDIGDVRPSRRSVRVTVMVIVLLSSGYLAQSYASSPSVVADKYESGGISVPPRDDITVITTSPRSTSEAAIIAFTPNGSLLYYNDTYDWYFDVDPVPGSRATVEYVAVGLTTENCFLSARIARHQACSVNVVERVNLTTGSTERLYTRRTRPKDIGGWHDADRINSSHLLVAGSTNDRVFIVNLSSGIITWQWEAQSHYDTGQGGVYPTDWTHINDVSYLDDGRVIVSVRNHDQVLFLEPRTGVLDDWTLGQDDRHRILYEQHNPDYIPPERGGPALLVADSENNRIVEYRRGNDGMWERTWNWRDEDLRWGRDADRLPNGHTLITDSNGNRVLEVDQNGDIVWSVSIDTPYEAERFESGDESSGGMSARRLNLQSRSMSVMAPTEGTSPVRRFLVGLSTLLPGFVVNGIVFLMPAWFDAVDLIVSVVLVSSLVAWGVIEFWWSPYVVRSPIARGPD